MSNWSEPGKYRHVFTKNKNERLSIMAEIAVEETEKDAGKSEITWEEDPKEKAGGGGGGTCRIKNEFPWDSQRT